jgi:hypothetical protein
MAASPYCPRCGAANPPEEITCFACGGALDVAPGAHADLGLRRVLRGRYRPYRSRFLEEREKKKSKMGIFC